MDAVISPKTLYDLLGVAPAPLLADARLPAAFAADDRLIVGAVRRRPEDLERWRDALPGGRSLVVYCGDGGATSCDIVVALRSAGVSAAALAGGMAGWRALGLPTRRKRDETPGRWITRERPTIDRIACPWLVRRFIDPEAEFLYVPASTVRAAAQSSGAMPYDVPDVAFGHHGERCSFDAFIAAYDIADPALDRLAAIVRGADTGRPDLTPQSAGLLAVSQGLKVNFTDDHAMLAQGMVVYDALYAWCRQQVARAA